MKLRALISLLALGLAWCTTGHAGITDFQYTSDYTNFSCSATISYNLDHSVGTVDMDSYQYGLRGLMGGVITTDAGTGASLAIHGAVDNDTTSSWIGYDITLYMNRAFTLSGVGVGPLPPGWTFTSTPTAVPGPGTYYGASEYVASIHYTQSVGPVVPPGGEFDFAYTLNFAGATGYSFTAEMNAVVPEPSIAALGLLGAGVLFARYRQNRNRAH